MQVRANVEIVVWNSAKENMYERKASKESKNQVSHACRNNFLTEDLESQQDF